jgi:hypothetical protein
MKHTVSELASLVGGVVNTTPTRPAKEHTRTATHAPIKPSAVIVSHNGNGHHAKQNGHAPVSARDAIPLEAGFRDF